MTNEKAVVSLYVCFIINHNLFALYPAKALLKEKLGIKEMTSNSNLFSSKISIGSSNFPYTICGGFVNAFDFSQPFLKHLQILTREII